ncbi:MAG: DUF3109 family protein [Bacteroidales bacterium]|nr:DUF3109 family protein [Bacteroidales bacterium]
MIEIDDKVVSTELLTEHFCCDLSQCHGLCCVHGDSGAPLQPDEADTLQRIMPHLRPHLRPEGVAAVEQQGTAIIDRDGDLVTPLVGTAECAYAVFDGPTALCGIERAWLAGDVDFRKPISCHLYPIRTRRYSGFEALNYDRWSVCQPACELGKRHGTPVYQSVRQAIERAYGAEFYQKLCEAHRLLQQSDDERQ